MPLKAIPCKAMPYKTMPLKEMQYKEDFIFQISKISSPYSPFVALNFDSVNVLEMSHTARDVATSWHLPDSPKSVGFTTFTHSVLKWVTIFDARSGHLI